MYYFIVDTCIWLNLGSDIMDTRIIDKLTNLVNEEKVCIILPSIVKEEWEKHKNDKIIKFTEQSLKGKLNNIKEISGLVSEEKFQIINKISELESEIREESRIQAYKMIDKIEYLFKYRTTRQILYNGEVKNLAIQWGLGKKAPMHKKSSMADTLIILNSIYYIKKYSLYPSIFITANKDDFSRNGNPKQIHEDLENLFKENRIEYYINIGEALNKVETRAISDELIEKIEKQSNERLCYRCGATIIDQGSYQRSQYGGLTWQYRCYGCGTYFDTGEFCFDD